MSEEKLNQEETNNVEGQVVELSEEIKTENDGIKIADDVVAVIAGMAISEIQGVAGMAGGFAGGITEVFSGKKSLSKGVKVDILENKAKIHVNIIVDYGTRIPDIAYEIQTKVKKAVENMTGLNVEEVNVNVQGVRTETSKEVSSDDNTSN